MTRTLKDHFKVLSEIEKNHSKRFLELINEFDKQTISPEAKRVLFVCEYIVKDIKTIREDIAYRTERLAEEENELNSTVNFLINTVDKISRQVKGLTPIQKDIQEIKTKQKEFQQTHDAIQGKVKEKAEERKKQIEEDESKLRKGLPGIC